MPATSRPSLFHGCRAIARKPLMLAGVFLGGLALAGAATARDQIAIVGSSTVFPFSSAVAEQFAARGEFRTPKVESTGTGGGLSIFCRGVGPNTPDIANASRRIKLSEFEACQRAGVRDIVEVQVGFDGIVLANAKTGPVMAMNKHWVYMALAKELPSRGRLIANPFTRWRQIDPSLPDVKIDVMGPPPTSGTRDAFVEIVMEKGATVFPYMADLKKKDDKAFKAAATTLREDGAWKDSGENDNLIVQALSRNPTQFGVFGFSFYEENMDRVRATTMNGVVPTSESISSGEYPAARSLYFYLKRQHVGIVPGLAEFAAEFVSDRSAGARGYLRQRGMVPMPAALRASVEADTRRLRPMAAPKK
jgi:phosphate transport system substrate-binding protein